MTWKSGEIEGMIREDSSLGPDHVSSSAPRRCKEKESLKLHPDVVSLPQLKKGRVIADI